MHTQIYITTCSQLSLLIIYIHIYIFVNLHTQIYAYTYTGRTFTEAAYIYSGEFYLAN